MFKKTLFLIGILSSLTFSQGDLIYNYGLQEVIDSLLPRPLDETTFLIGQDADNGWDVKSREKK